MRRGERASIIRPMYNPRPLVMRSPGSARLAEYGIHQKNRLPSEFLQDRRQLYRRQGGSRKREIWWMGATRQHAADWRR